MEGEKKEEGKKMGKAEERKFLDKVMKRLKMGIKAYEHNTSESIEDLKFLNGDQWDEDEKKRRKLRKRPILTINMLPEKVDKVIGDIRQNRAKIKIRPADINANKDIALIREGIIRKIEYDSNAAAIYDYTGGRVAECGHGAWRYLTRYCEDNPFIQEIYVSLIKNSFSVIIDPSAKEPNKADAKWAFIISKMDKDEFEDAYPKAQSEPNTFNELGEGLGSEHWWDSKAITVAEYFEIKHETVTKCLMKDGTVVDKSKADEMIKEWESNQIKQGSPVMGVVSPPPSAPIPPPQGIPPQLSSPQASTPPLPMNNGTVPMNNVPSPMSPPAVVGPPPPPRPEVLREKDTKVPKVYHYIVTALDVLDGPNRIPGKYIPIVEVTGKERDIEGKTYVRGLVRDAKDPQRLVNYWNTAASEEVALAPKAPWVGTAKQFEGYEEDYANANVDSMPFLKYNPDKNAPGPPQRNRPGDAPVAMFSQISIAERNLDRITGGLELREAAPDASKAALLQRQKPTELSTFTFIDNLAQAICWGGKIMNEMIPEVYDTERDANVRNEDDTEAYVPINTTADEAVKLIDTNPERYKGLNASKIRSIMLMSGRDSRFNDLGMGKYSVTVDLGPSYATQRQESSDNFVKLAQTNPKLWNIAGDLIVESLDILGATKMAARIKKTIPPNLIEPEPGQPPKPPQIPPAIKVLLAKAQTEEVKQKKEMLKTQVELIRLYKETQESDKEIRQKILDVLEKLHSKEHFADQIIQQQEEGGQQ